MPTNYTFRDQPLFNSATITSVVTILSVLIFFLIQIFSVFIANYVLVTISPDKFTNLNMPIFQHGTILSVSILFNLLLLFLFVFIILRVRKRKLQEYLAISPFNLRIAMISFFLWLVYLITSEVILDFLHPESTMDFLDVYYKSADPLYFLIFGIVILAPIYEELIFRGLLWSAIADQFLDKNNTINQKGAIVASLITALLFAGIHLQYDIYEISTIFFLALILGFARYRSGSLLLPIIIHIVNNGLSMIEYIWL